MSELIVKTKAGKVRGKKEKGLDGTEFYSFKGIPYATPPVGELRFRDPQPLKSWAGVREATTISQRCAQFDSWLQLLTGSDDCLYLNVYSRCIAPKQRWPVMVYIHGGGFSFGSSDDSFYGPDYFMSKDVVLVTINYRVGVLGFLSLDDEVAPGNQGFKDQVMALQWVRDNIANFGGDPNNVTIFGESAGGASVHFLTLSPLAKGLFHKAIAQSGVILNPWAYHSNLREKAYKLCEELGHKGKDPESIVAFLRSIDAHKLILASEKILTKEEKAAFLFSFGPGTDSKSNNPFLLVHPEEVKESEVPMIIGYTSREGLAFLKGILERLKEFGNDPRKAIPSSTRNTFKKLFNLSVDELVLIYFNGESLTNENHDKMADFMGDMYFVEGIQRIIKNRIDQNCGPTYVYQLTYDKDPSVFKTTMNIQINGVAHGDDLELFFRQSFYDSIIGPPKKGSGKYKVLQQMIELWVNFATTGSPTPKFSELLPIDWQPVNKKTGLRYLNIGEDLRMEVAPHIAQQYMARKYPKHVP